MENNSRYLGRLKNYYELVISLPSRKKQCNVTLVNQRHYTAQLAVKPISNTQAVTIAYWSGSCKKTSARELLVGVIASCACVKLCYAFQLILCSDCWKRCASHISDNHNPWYQFCE